MPLGGNSSYLLQTLGHRVILFAATNILRHHGAPPLCGQKNSEVLPAPVVHELAGHYPFEVLVSRSLVFVAGSTIYDTVYNSVSSFDAVVSCCVPTIVTDLRVPTKVFA
jgi:hypothetical protein